MDDVTLTLLLCSWPRCGAAGCTAAATLVDDAGTGWCDAHEDDALTECWRAEAIGDFDPAWLWEQQEEVDDDHDDQHHDDDTGEYYGACEECGQPADTIDEDGVPLCDQCDYLLAEAVDAQPRLTPFDAMPGGGVCRCLHEASPVVCDDCPRGESGGPL